MNQSAINPLPDQRHGRLMLALIVGLLALPFAIAAGLYVGGWQPSKTSHHGHLLSPPRLLPVHMLHPEGTSFGVRSTGKNSEKWLLLLHVRGPCTAECADRLDEMRRIQVALYKNMGRLNRAVLTDQPDDPALLAQRKSQPDLWLLSARSDPLAGDLADPLPGITDPLLLVDPQGQIIMTYPPDARAQDVRTDLERLLKYAWTG